MVVGVAAFSQPFYPQMVADLPWQFNTVGPITTQQSIVPAGASVLTTDAVYAVAYDPAGALWASVGGSLLRVDTRANRAWTTPPAGLRLGYQGLMFDPRTGEPLTAAGGGRALDPRGNGLALGRWNGESWQFGDLISQHTSGNTALSALLTGDGRRLAVMPLTYESRVALVDTESGRLLGKVITGQAPFAAVLNADSTVAYVSNWGGRFAQPGDVSSGNYPLVIDRRGSVISGTVSRIDLERRVITSTIEVGQHPTALSWDQTRQRLYVANSNGDSISVLDTAVNRVTATWPLRPFGLSQSGAVPTAMALSSDGSRLYVAVAGLNAVAVITCETGEVLGYIPTGWFPASIALSPDGLQLAVGCLRGSPIGTAAAPAGVGGPTRKGMISQIPIPDAAQLADYTTVVAAANRMAPTDLLSRSAQTCPPGDPIPVCASGGSPIKHVVLIVRENRTYDQVLGDLPIGNNDPSLTQYGWALTPNAHQLASTFVTLDNFYATGGTSAEGHLWLTQAHSPSYVYWPGYIGRSYPFDGTDPLAHSPNGFLWDAAQSRGLNVRVYGELVPAVPTKAGQRAQMLRQWAGGESFSSHFASSTTIPGLKAVLATHYPGYSLGVPDVVRAQLFTSDLEAWSRSGEMPHLVILQLPGDHTMGVSPGESTPEAMIADNDYALGTIVEALSRSPFWPKMAIFVVEDDAQDGVDHVDGHRTVALVASPFAKRASLDSTFYSHQSIVKTIELILGLPTLSLFDLIATDMRESFQSEPDLSPLQVLVPQQSLFELTPRLGALKGYQRRDALATLKMDFTEPDDVPSDVLNRILWRRSRGPVTPYPARRGPVFRPWAPGLVPPVENVPVTR